MIVILKNSENLWRRTIQRWLSKHTAYGYVAYTYNGYYLLAKGKREIQFRNFAKGYGTMTLNSLADIHFPTLNTDESNLQKLIEIFGLYIVYCLIEAARLVTTNRKDKEDHWRSSYFDNETNFDIGGKFKDRQFVNSWILYILNPINMLNLFLTAILNSPVNSEKDNNDNETILRYSKYLEENDMNTFAFKTASKLADPNVNGRNFPPTVLDLLFKRVISSSYENQNEPTWMEFWKEKQRQYPILMRCVFDDYILYELDDEKLAILKNILKQTPFILQPFRECG